MMICCYENKTTGEVTLQKEQAMDWYRAGDEVALMDWSDTCNGWIERGYWAHA